jgi:CheY-like chemotaxis protein
VDLTQRRQIERMRSDFVSTVSHELRTPLTSIGASLGLILSGAMGMLPEDAAAMVRIANNNSDRLMRIINDILDIGGLESGGFTLQTTNSSAAELIEQAIEANAAFAREFAVRFRFEGTPADDRILVDPDRFIQVITNLLSNAAKFSPSGAEVLIRIRTDAAVIRIEVEDFGPGVPESFQGRIFERFAQADASPSRRFSGTGLGLSIARKLVEAMGGTIGFHSVAGKGSVFHVELPRAAPAPSGRPDHPPAATAAAHAAPRILCVEDDHDFVSLIRETLGERATIVGAHTLEEAEVSLRGGDFALVVLDQSLPDGTGLSLIDLIPEVLGASVPIVILSATEVPHALHHKVAAVLIKSRIPAAQIATTILSYLPLPAD